MDFSSLYKAEGESEDEADVFARSLVEEMERENAEGYEPPPRCYACDELDQTTACRDCRRGYCSACIFEHRLVKRFSKHRECTLEELAGFVAADAEWREEFRRKEAAAKVQREEERRASRELAVAESRRNKAHAEAEARVAALGLQISFEYTAGTQYYGNAIEAPPKRKVHPPTHPSAKAARSFGIPQHCIEKLGVPIPHGRGKLYRGPPTNGLIALLNFLAEVGRGYHLAGRPRRADRADLSPHTRYEGRFHLGAMNGPGRFYWPDGSSWEGGFKDNRKHGRGIFRPAHPRDRPRATYYNFDRKICEDVDLHEGVRLKVKRRGVTTSATIVKWNRKTHRHMLRFDFSDKACAWTDLSLEDFDIADTEARTMFLPHIAPDPNDDAAAAEVERRDSWR